MAWDTAGMRTFWTTSGASVRIFARASIFFFKDPATTEIYTLSLHDALPISTPFSHPDVIARTLLARHNIDPAEVKLANMGGDADRYRALVARVVDATVVSSEYVPIAAKNNIHQLVSAREIVPDYMRLCMFSSGRTLGARHEDAVRFLAAEMSALRYALAHRDAAIRLTQELIGA